MKTCNTCKHWKRVTTGFPREMLGGICYSAKLTEPYEDEAYNDDSLTYSYDESGDFWTGPKFGCVHHEEGEG